MVHYYDIWIVSDEEYDAIPLGSSYQGGTVIEGSWCEETNEFLIITVHYENECPDCHGSGLVEAFGIRPFHCDTCEGTGSVSK